MSFEITQYVETADVKDLLSLVLKSDNEVKYFFSNLTYQAAEDWRLAFFSRDSGEVAKDIIIFVVSNDKALATATGIGLTSLLVYFPFAGAVTAAGASYLLTKALEEQLRRFKRLF